jgi:hypothetical protein
MVGLEAKVLFDEVFGLVDPFLINRFLYTIKREYECFKLCFLIYLLS